MRRRLLSLAAVAAMAMALLATPASATVHEITGMVCSGGNAVFNPPGVSGANGASSVDNQIRPLLATGFATIDPFYDGSTATPAGAPAPLVTFDEDHPASKINLTGDIVFIAEAGLYITEFEFTRGNWQNCL